jgi:DNA-binding FadR family transcriptional regulator
MVDGDRLNKNLTARIMDDLGRAIVTGRYQIGAILPFEDELQHHFNASRTVLREAIKMLTAKGLLEARQRRGTIVQPEERWNLLDPEVLGWMLGREFSIDLLIDFTELRLAIEPRAASLAAQTASDGQRQAIVAAIGRMYAAETGTDDPLESDIAFHVAVLQASNNRFMRQFTDVADTTLRFSIRRTNEYKGVSRASAAEHQGVADLIIRGEAERAQSAMFDLIQRALDLLLSAGGHRKA